MVGTGAAGDGDYLIVDNIHNAKAGTPLYIAASGYGVAVKCRLMAQTGAVNVTPIVGAATAIATATYRYSYGSKTPNVTANPQVGLVNGKTIVGWPSSTLAATAGINIRTADSTNFGVAVPDVAVVWTAAVCEI
jgi:hypothetical protein